MDLTFGTTESEKPSAQHDRNRHLSPINAHIGSRIRLRRTLMGMSEEDLSQTLGLTLHQLQEHEHGLHRIGASRLFDMCQALDVPLSYLYDDLPEPPPTQHTQHSTTATSNWLSDGHDLSGDSSAEQHDMLNKREGLELLRAYYRIKEPSIRKRVYDLIKSMGPSYG